MDYYERIPELKQALDMINGGFFSPDAPGQFADIYNSLVHDDRYNTRVSYLSGHQGNLPIYPNWLLRY